MTAAALLSIVLLGSVLSLWQTARANRARQQAIIAEKQARDAEADAQKDRADALAQREIAEQRGAEARQNEQKSHAAELAARESEATTKEVLDFVKTHIFAAARPPLTKAGLGREVTLRAALDAAEPKIASAFATRPRVEAQLRSVLAGTYQDLGETKLAVTQAERAFELAKKHFGIDDRFTVDHELALSSFYRHSGRVDDAYQMMEKSLARRRETLGHEAPMTVATLWALANGYQEDGRYDAAKKIGEELLALHLQNDLTDEKPVKFFRLCSFFELAGRTREAAELAERGIEKLTPKLGADDIWLLRLNKMLAFYYDKLDRQQEANAIREAIFERSVRTRGITNSETLGIMQSLTVGYGNAGRYADEVRVLEAAIPVLRKELGPAHDLIAPHVINLTVAYTNLGKHREAAKLLEETIGAIPEEDRKSYVNLDFMLTSLAGCYMSLEDFPGAIRTLNATERLNRSRYPANSLRLASLLVMDGNLRLEIEEYVGAERVFRDAYEIRKAMEPEAYRVPSSRMLLGCALAGQKRFSEAEPLLLSGYNEIRGRWAEIVGEVGQIRIMGLRIPLETAGRRLALMYQAMGEFDKAIMVCREANAFGEKQNHTSPETLFSDACWHAVTSSVLKSITNEESNRLADEETDRAMASLKQAVKAGFKDWSAIKLDHHLDALRDREDFQQLLDDLIPKQKE